MKKKIILYIATSLDGFIARKNGSVDWLSPYEKSGEDYGYKEFYDKVGTLIMGNTTYQQTISFGNFPYNEKECFVFSKTTNKCQNGDISFVNGDVKKFIEELKPKDDKNIWLVGGASTIDKFLKHDLIDEYIISIIPLLLGEGIHLFKEKNVEKSLKLLNTKSYDSGLIQIHYKRLKA